MASIRRLVLVLGLMSCAITSAFGQASTMSKGSFDFNTNGIVFQTADSANRVIMRFRMQNWATYVTESETDLSAAYTDLVVRRLRLRFGGNLLDPRLTFNIQLSFSRSDQDFNDTEFANIVRDAMVFWNFNENLQVGFGQTKLPGNRQRVISSADLEFPDRSIVNGAFNLDRDFGLQGFWRPLSGPFVVNLRGAVSSGDGRNQNPIEGGGFAYTGRVEVLPFGQFQNGGDYFESDLQREPTPKVSIGLSAQHNEAMNRTRGELGKELYAQRTADVVYGDALLKWMGLSFYTEWAQRTAADPITYDPDDSSSTRAVFVGHGYMFQTTYTFPFHLMLGLRFATTEAEDALQGTSDYKRIQHLSGVITYFFNRHRIKSNIEFGEISTTDLSTPDITAHNLFARLNVELGI